MKINTWFLISAVSCGGTGDLECETAVTYESFGQGFLEESCQPCHSSSSANRYGAPEAIFFDTREVVFEQLDEIYRVTLSEAADMPPSGGITELDRELLELWLGCMEEK